ncbi:hypothetical protein SAMN05444172_2604 [Burkholderia sp. GAS332]|nr:hypothetical protein SAMN05444172_2604 [Burkholderia sp. GAS332]
MRTIRTIAAIIVATVSFEGISTGFTVARALWEAHEKIEAGKAAKRDMDTAFGACGANESDKCERASLQLVRDGMKAE